MHISKNWLQEYVQMPKSLSPKDLELKLTMAVVEVEGFYEEGENLEKVVVAKILKIEKHPNADKLSIATVDAGSEKLKVVCGGNNLKEGMLVALARVGAKVRWHGEDEWTELEPAKIRGVESRGMICASEELGLPASMSPEGGILDISQTKAKPGTKLAEALDLNDIIYDIDNKSLTHRPDLWGHYGMARELAALFDKKLSKLDLAKISKAAKGKKLSVEVLDKKLCPRYLGLVVDNIKIAPSPFWMQKRLAAVGVRPINNIVDVTNYVMLELGQPLHAFDYKQIPEGKIIVRRAKDKEIMTTLDDEKRQLKKDMLVIANAKYPIAVAGVMGGANSEISPDTKAIVIESANFEPYSVRKTASELGLRTESSARFEKSLDPNLAETAMLRAVELIKEVCPEAKVASPLADKADFKLDQGPVELGFDLLNKRIGEEVPKKQATKILTNLGFSIKEKNSSLSVKIPTWRATKDISIPEDLVEEVARIYGYDNITPELPKSAIVPPEQNEFRLFENRIISLLADLGLNEAYNYSFVSEKDLDQLGINKSKCIRIKNPMSEDQRILRPMLLPNLLKNIIANQKNFSHIDIFEIGSVHHRGKSKRLANPVKKTFLPIEAKHLGAVFSQKDSDDQFFAAKEILINMMAALNIPAELQEKEGEDLYSHPGRRAEITAGGQVIGEIFELHPAKQRALDIDERVGYFEINLDQLLDIAQKSDIKYKPLPKYPTVRRDLALICPQELSYRDLVEAMKMASDKIESIELFDIYRGQGLPEGTKSIALHLNFRDPKKTLEAEAIEKEVEKILSVLKNKNITLRQ